LPKDPFALASASRIFRARFSTSSTQRWSGPNNGCHLVEEEEEDEEEEEEEEKKKDVENERERTKERRRRMGETDKTVGFL